MKIKLLITISIILLFLALVFSYEKDNYETNETKTFAIHTVFIPKENILFLEEWLDYHSMLGFNKFYLYDNRDVKKLDNHDKKNYSHIIKPGKVNKHKIDYDEIVELNNEQIDDIFEKIQTKYKDNVKFIRWSPKDKKGKVMYAQVKAHNHCLKNYLKKDKIDWCASIDIDEFIILNNGTETDIRRFVSKYPKISNFKMHQDRYISRYNNINGNVLEINQNGKYDKYTKNFFKVKDTLYLHVHIWLGNWFHTFTSQKSDKNVIRYNHYTGSIVDKKDNKVQVNTHVNKDILEKIKLNSKNYFIKKIITN